MSITVIGLIVIPLTFAFFVARPDALAPWTILLAVFQGASILNFGTTESSIGISPYYFSASLLLVQSVLGRESWRALSRTTHIYLTPVLMFGAYAVLSSFLLPHLNENLSVDNWRAGSFIDVTFQTPLRWTISNLAQAIYTVLNTGVVIAMVSRAARPGQLRRFIQFFFWSGLIVVGVGLYQELAYAFGLAFPSAIFNSNISGIQLYEIVLSNLGIERLSSTFSEPSLVGAFLAAWVTFVILAGRQLQLVSWARMGAVIAGMTALLLTISSTAYATFAVILAFFALRFWLPLVSSLRLSRRELALTAGLGAALAAAFFAVPHTAQAIGVALVNKGTSLSTFFRFSSDLHALQLFSDTFGLGVGLGSDNSSSFVTDLLANLGLLGSLLFGFILIRTLSLARRALKRTPDSVVRAVRGAFLANLLAMALGVSQPNWPIFWTLLGLLLAVCRGGNELVDSQYLQPPILLTETL